jgi:hypothetical protein
MSRETPPFAVVGGTGGKASCDALASPSVPPLIDLDTSERRVWKYICDSLASAGLEHVAAGLPIAIIVRTYSDWIDAARECNDKGRYQTSENGWASEAPWAANERRLKSELSQWLPKACLTIPSLTRVKKDMGIQGGQDDLFSDLVGLAQERPSVSSG